MRKPVLLIYLFVILSFFACEEEDNLNKLPSKPELLYPENGTVIDINSIRFKWKQSSDPESDDVEYNLLVSSDSTNWMSVYNDKVAQTTITDTAVFELGKTYYWKVKAENDLDFNDAPQESGESVSDVNYFYTIPPVVKNLNATSGYEFINLSWEDPVDLDYVEIRFEPEVSSINQPIVINAGAEKLELTGLNNGTLYTFYLITYNNQGHQSNTDTIKALPLDPTQVHDADFNIYNITQIGNQTWLRENLKTSRWQDGTTIPVNYYRKSNDHDIYGYYYKPHKTFGEGADGKNPCPCGYHVPTDEEFKELERFLGMPEDEINRFSTSSDFYRGDSLDIADDLKTTSGWLDYNDENANGTDIYMFNLLPAGDFWGDYYGQGFYTTLYSSTIHSNNNYTTRNFSNRSDGVGRYSYDTVYGSVRCIKD